MRKLTREQRDKLRTEPRLTTGALYDWLEEALDDLDEADRELDMLRTMQKYSTPNGIVEELRAKLADCQQAFDNLMHEDVMAYKAKLAESEAACAAYRLTAEAILEMRCECDSKLRGYDCCWMPSDAQIYLREDLMSQSLGRDLLRELEALREVERAAREKDLRNLWDAIAAVDALRKSPK